MELSWEILAAGSARNKLCFRALCEQKKSRNGRDLPLPSIGEAKLCKFISLQVNNAFELLDFEDINDVFYSKRARNAKLHKWKAEGQEYFDAKHRRHA